MLNEDLMETILESDNCRQAYRQVKANAGAAGVDGMTVETFADHARVHWPVIKAKLKDGSYQPGAVRGVRIPKPNGGERRLGIPMLVSYCTSLQVTLGMMEPGQLRWPEVSIPPLG